MFNEYLADQRLGSLSNVGRAQARERLWDAYLQETGGVEKLSQLSEEGRQEARRRFDEYVATQRPDAFTVEVSPATTKKLPAARGSNQRGDSRTVEDQPAVRRPLYDARTESFIDAFKSNKFNPAELDDQAYRELTPLMRASLTKEEFDNFMSPFRERLMKRGLGPGAKLANSVVRGMVPGALEKAATNIAERFAGPTTLLDHYMAEKDYADWQLAYGEFDESARTAGAVAGVIGAGAGATKALSQFATRAGPKVMSNLIAAGAIDYAYSDRLPGFSADLVDDPDAKAALTAAEGMALALAPAAVKGVAGLMSDGKAARSVPASATRIDVEGISRQINTEALAQGTDSRIGGGIGRTLGVYSTQLAKIAPELAAEVRKFEFNLHTRSAGYRQQLEPWLEGTKRIPKKEMKELDLALMNGDEAGAQRIIQKHQLGDQFNQVKAVKDKLRDEAVAMGFEVGYIDNYWPRSVRDTEGLLKTIHGERGKWGEFDRALQAEAKKLGVDHLDPESQAEVLNGLIRGFGKDKAMLAAPENLKQRQIRTVPVEWAGFYHDSNSALLNYVDSIVNATEKRRFFGQADTLANPLLTNTAVGITKVGGSVGDMVSRLVSQGRILPQDQAPLAEMLRNRVIQKPGSKTVRNLKSLMYIDSMGSPTSAITQLGDWTWAAYEDGLLNLPGNLLGKKPIKLNELGIEKIAAEFGTQGWLEKATNTVFKGVGITAMDRLGKETLLNASFNKFNRQAMSAGSKEYRQLSRDLVQTFGQEAPQVMNDLANRRMSDNVKFLLFNRLSDFQPISLSEVPENYLKHPNGRVFYALKTFTVKQMDVYRREAFQKMRNGNVKEGLGNLIKLGGLTMMFGATSDQIKDVMLNRNTEIPDMVVDNILRTAGVNKFAVWEARRTKDVPMAAAKMIMPPTRVLRSSLRDAEKIIEGEFEMKNAETIQSLPFAGKLYYWWMGGGAERALEEGTQRF